MNLVLRVVLSVARRVGPVERVLLVVAVLVVVVVNVVGKVGVAAEVDDLERLLGPPGLDPVQELVLAHVLLAGKLAAADGAGERTVAEVDADVVDAVGLLRGRVLAKAAEVHEAAALVPAAEQAVQLGAWTLI